MYVFLSVPFKCQHIFVCIVRLSYSFFIFIPGGASDISCLGEL
jgi:hypothetical protein